MHSPNVFLQCSKLSNSIVLLVLGKWKFQSEIAEQRQPKRMTASNKLILSKQIFLNVKKSEKSWLFPGSIKLLGMFKEKLNQGWQLFSFQQVDFIKQNQYFVLPSLIWSCLWQWCTPSSLYRWRWTSWRIWTFLPSSGWSGCSRERSGWRPCPSESSRSW